MSANQPIKMQISVLTALVCLAIAGILTIQGLWLFNSYRISKQQTEANIQKTFDEGILEYKSLKADTVRDMLKKAIRSGKGFNYTFFRYPSGLHIGYRDSNRAYIMYPVNLADEASVAKNPYGYLLAKLNTLSLDELRPLYSSLIGGRGYKPKSVDDSLQNQLMLHYANLYADTGVMNRVLKNTFARNRMRFEGTTRYFADVKNVYKQHKPKPILTKSSLVIEERPVAVTPNNKSLPAKLQELSDYIKKLNDSKDSSYFARPLFYDINDVFLGKTPVMMLAIKTPGAYVLKNMLVNIVGAFVLMLFLGFCMIYMLYIIARQRKLSDIKNDFISNISHELKTPIATALAAVQGMRYFDVQKDEHKTGQYLDTASAELQRLSGMVNKILSTSVFESSQFEINPVKFDLEEMLGEIIAGMQLIQPERTSITLNYSATKEIFADKTYLYQAINNLVDNALKYSGDAPNILIICRDVQGGIEMSVEDNGPGIAKEYQKHIFDKFFRAPQADGHRVKGHGLGLNYVKAMIEKHRGKVELTKSDNTGSIFTIYLPQ
ncbi:MAG: HAMP domain-containing sensor histidine kinase [Bacteroidota bacterium]